MKLFRLVVPIAAALVTISCTLSNNTGAVHAKQNAAMGDAVATPESWSSEALQKSVPTPDWLKSFNDPMMLKLIAEGKANNPNLKVSSGNMEKAWLLAKQSGVGLKPTADLSVSGSQSGSVDNQYASSRSVNVGLQASWELDVWDRVGSGVQAAQANAQSAQADYLFAQHSLSANIAKNYFKVIEANLQAQITRKNVKVLKETMRITKVKYDNGLTSAQDMALNRANLASAREQLILLEGSQRDAARALEVLLGRYPNAQLDISTALPTLPPSPPAGIPSEILERRPDIISAERQIASAFNATNKAKAAQLPRFSLTSTVSGASNSLSDVLNPVNMAWQLASNIVAPLFDGGKRQIDVDIATTEQNQAVSNYAQKALTAFSEVESNLDQGQVLARREVELNDVVLQSNKAYRIASLRYKEGEIGLLDALQIQQQAIAAESNLLSIKRSQLEQRVNLYLALGGGW